MIDHLIRCATPDDADVLEADYGSWCAFQTHVVLIDAVWDNSDPEDPVMLTPEVTASGYHVWIALDALSETLRDLPDNACRLIGDNSLSGPDATWHDVLLYHAPDISDEVLDTAMCDRVPFGSDYPWRRVRA